MNRDQAKNILSIYREGIDGADPQFATARAEADRDPVLHDWLFEHQKSYRAVRRKFGEIEVPKNLREKIVRERPVPFPAKWSYARVLQLAAVIAVLAGLAFFWLRPPERNSFTAYERNLAMLVSKNYRMSLESNNLDRIRSFLAKNQAPADYRVPRPLEQTTAVGATTLSWHGNPVSMLCFADEQGHKLWLFVVSHQATPDPPSNSISPKPQKEGFVTAGWTENGYTYVLVTKGEADALKKYL